MSKRGGTQHRISRRSKRAPDRSDSSGSPETFLRTLDARTLEVSEWVGSDNTKEHEVSFWMYTKTEGDAIGLASAVQAERFEVTVSSPAAHRDSWLVLAYRTMIPSPHDLESIRKRLSRIAKRFGGEFDGWEMEV